MPFETPSHRTLAIIEAVNEDGTVTIPITGVVAGHALVVGVAGVQASSSQAVIVNTVSDNATPSANTWSIPSNVRADTDYAPSVSIAYAENVKAGDYTITISVDKSGANQINIVVVEVAGVLISSAIEGVIREGVGDGSLFTLTSATGTLSQEVVWAFIASAGWYGNPDLQADSTLIKRTHNGSGPGYVGSLFESKVVTSPTSFQGRVDHSQAGTPNVSIAMLLLKAKSLGNLRIKIQADPATLVDADGPWTVRLWRNGNPESVLARAIAVPTPLPAAGLMYITGAAIPYTGLSLSDTLLANIIGTNNHTGIIPAIVEVY